MSELVAYEAAYVLGIVEENVLANFKYMTTKIQNSQSRLKPITENDEIFNKVKAIFFKVFNKYIKNELKFKDIYWNVDFFGEGVSLVDDEENYSKEELKVINNAQDLIMQKVSEIAKNDSSLPKITMTKEYDYPGYVFFYYEDTDFHDMSLNEFYVQYNEAFNSDYKIINIEMKKFIERLRNDARFKVTLANYKCQIHKPKASKKSFYQGYLEIDLLKPQDIEWYCSNNPDSKLFTRILYQGINDILDSKDIKLTYHYSIEYSIKLWPKGTKSSDLNESFMKYKER